MPSETVLLVDDDDAFRTVIARELGRAGWPVRRAASVREGIAAARELRPPVLLLDLRLPGMDGLELAEEVKPRVDARCGPAVDAPEELGEEVHVGEEC